MMQGRNKNAQLQAALPLSRAHSQYCQPNVNHPLPTSHIILLQSSKQPLLINQEFFGIWSLPSRNLHFNFGSKTKRGILSKTVLQRRL